MSLKTDDVVAAAHAVVFADRMNNYADMPRLIEALRVALGGKNAEAKPT